MENGTRVKKIWCDPTGDLHPIGSTGKIVGIIEHPSLGNAYFVEWDSSGVVSLAVEKKLEQLPSS